MIGFVIPAPTPWPAKSGHRNHVQSYPLQLTSVHITQSWCIMANKICASICLQCPSVFDYQNMFTDSRFIGFRRVVWRFREGTVIVNMPLWRFQRSAEETLFNYKLIMNHSSSAKVLYLSSEDKAIQKGTFCDNNICSMNGNNSRSNLHLELGLLVLVHLPKWFSYCVVDMWRTRLPIKLPNV